MNVAHEGKPCIHCHTPYPRASFMCPARVSELVRVVSELDVTADGVPITPKTELWQAHPWVNWTSLGYPQPWLCSQDHSCRRDPDKPVYSTSEAVRKAEL